MNGFLIPANAKKGTLILNVFRPIDFIMFCTGACITLIMFLIVDTNNTTMLLISCIPVGVTGLLVIPIPNYHNVLCAIQSILRFFVERRNYYWRGWCFYEKFGDKK